MRAVEAVSAVPDETLRLAREMERMFQDLADDIGVFAPSGKMPDGRSREEAARAAAMEVIQRHAAGETSLEVASATLLELMEVDPRPVITTLREEFGLDPLIAAVAIAAGREVAAAVLGDPPLPSTMGLPVACVG
jgi:hypothetical protein